jgi:hypothetical protein
MVLVGVADVAGLRVRRHHDHRHASPIAEERNGLDVAGVVVAAALVEGDEDRGALPQRRVALDLVDGMGGERFERRQR